MKHPTHIVQTSDLLELAFQMGPGPRTDQIFALALDLLVVYYGTKLALHIYNQAVDRQAYTPEDLLSYRQDWLREC